MNTIANKSFAERRKAKSEAELPSKLKALVVQAIAAWPQFDSDKPVNGADLVEWFADWREDAKALMREAGK